MKLIAPDYLPLFKCIAGDCRHSCCIGWEIGVDEDSLQRYAAEKGPMGDRLREHIDWANACFRLGEGEKCPFLNENGLCDMIIHMGEDSLCQICADHPRFRNYLSDRVEMGLGLCCEAAAEMILMRSEPVKLICLEDDGGSEEPDAGFLALRERLLSVIQDRTRPILQRVDSMLDMCAARVDADGAHWADMLEKLERLDDRWLDMLSRLREESHPVDDRWEVPLEQLMVYLIFRHLSGALEDGDVQGRAAYCGLMWKLIRRMMRGDLCEVCRLYSSEIEYSDENVEEILTRIDDELT